MKKIQAIQLKMQALLGIDIMSIIPTETLTAIKQKDAHPYFQAYSICHEGVASPIVLQGDSKPIHWFRKAIQSIKNVILKGVKFFIGHNEDNSTDNRETVGEIVADVQKEINGKLHHIAIGYFPDKEKVKDMDMCSQESKWNLLEHATHYIADTIDKVTGIALVNSNEEKPAFSNAKRLATVQALEYNEDKENLSGKDKEKEMDLSTIPFPDLKAELARRNAFPSQLFNIDDIKKDREFNSVFADNETLKKTVTEKDAQIETITKEKKDVDKTLASSTAKPRLEKILKNKEKPFSDEQKAYVLKRYDGSLEDVSDESLMKYAEDRIKDLKVLKDLKEGVEETEENPGTKQKVDTKDMTKAENNELLEEDLVLNEA